MPFKDLLRKLREAAGLTQEQLATKAGIPIGSYRNLEQGQRGPGWPAVVKIAKALGVTADTFSECDEVSEPEKPAPKKAKGKK